MSLVVSGALLREKGTESHALVPEAYQAGRTSDEMVLLRLILPGGLPLTYMFDRDDAQKLSECLRDCLEEV